MVLSLCRGHEEYSITIRLFSFLYLRGYYLLRRPAIEHMDRGRYDSVSLPVVAEHHDWRVKGILGIGSRVESNGRFNGANNPHLRFEYGVHDSLSYHYFSVYPAVYGG